MGRIGLAIAPSEPDVLYAVVEATDSALFRSENKGGSFVRLDSSFNTVSRPFYFSHLAVDPTNAKRIYKLGMLLSVSDDGGESFTMPFVGGGDIHPDLHAIWINPSDSTFLILGTDGGIYQSRDRGNTWTFINNLPVSQFYHVSADNDRPYNVYGGLQDNGSWMGPSRSPGGIENQDWTPIGGGDGFHVWRDPKANNILYLEYQGGNLLRYNLDTKETKEIKPFPEKGEPDYRFNWDTPIHLSQRQPGVIYVGAQFVFRSTNKGDSWKRISGDLTTNDPSKQRQEESGGLTIDNSTAENHCSVYTISESPITRNTIWAGTDDGNLQVTTNAGKTWTNVVQNIKGLPKGTWVSSVHASHHNRRLAYAVFDGHRTGDMLPYIFVTNDTGRSWTSLSTDEIKGFAKVIREDPVNQDLLFLGTEFGLFLSVNRGKNWAHMRGEFPKVSVRDLVIHPREADLIIATHGRGIYILDDITPLRHLNEKVLSKNVQFLPSRASLMRIPSGQQSFPGDHVFSGSNPSEVANITYYLRRRHVFGDLRLEIYDPDGKKIATLPGSRRRGINRVRWNMRRKPPKVAPSPTLAGRAMVGPMVPVGTYTAKLIKGKKTYSTKFELKWNPSSPHSKRDREIQQKTVLKLYDMQDDLAFLSTRMTQARDEAKKRADQVKESAEPLKKDLQQFADRLDQLHKKTVATKKGFLTGEEQLRERIVELYGAVSSYGGRPTRSQRQRLAVLKGQMTQTKRTLKNILAQALDKLNARLIQNKQKPIKLIEKAQFDKQELGGTLTKKGIFKHSQFLF